MSEMLLETRNLTKQYGHHKAVDSVDMHIKKGAIYGFIGRNFKADLWRNRDVRIQGKGSAKGSIPGRMSD